MKKREIRIRCWVDIDGQKFFGPGRATLLELIEQTGSIAKACKSMGMSYKKGFDMVTELNELGRQPYVIAHKGGAKGGGAEITEGGKKVMAAYKKLMKKFETIVAKDNELVRLV
jgi:molybdate transport system regulatory protein